MVYFYIEDERSLQFVWRITECTTLLNYGKSLFQTLTLDTRELEVNTSYIFSIHPRVQSLQKYYTCVDITILRQMKILFICVSIYECYQKRSTSDQIPTPSNPRNNSAHDKINAYLNYRYISATKQKIWRLSE